MNLLTPTRVAAASKEIKSGEIVPVNLPLDCPKQPAFGREVFKHEIKVLVENIAYDDLYVMNTQSGTQWDGFRHVGVCALKHMLTSNKISVRPRSHWQLLQWRRSHEQCFSSVPYTDTHQTKGSDIVGPNANHKCSVHHWAEHGIAGRGVLLDYRGYAHKKGINYDPYDYYPISWEELYQCGKDQGIDIRPAAQGGDIKIGDMLFVRSGWKEAYDQKSPEAREKAALRHGSGKDGEDGLRYAGLSQEQKILDWLHDCYFATVAGDAPAFEAWPTHEGIIFCGASPLRVSR